MAATIGGTIKLTLLDYQGTRILSSQGFRRIYLQEGITGGMPYGCKSSDENYLSGCDISVCCIATT
jgi:hypothetical protein